MTLFNELKLNRKYRYIVYRLNDDLTSVVVERAVQGTADYDAFVSSLPENDCRWVVYDFEFQKSPAEGQRNKLIFIAWYNSIDHNHGLFLTRFRSPETSKIKQKMVYASTKEGFKKRLVGVGVEVQATDFSEISYDAVLEKARQF